VPWKISPRECRNADDCAGSNLQFRYVTFGDVYACSNASSITDDQERLGTTWLVVFADAEF